MPLYGQHVTPRQAMTHLTFSQIELSWTGGGGGGGGVGVNTRTSSLHGALFVHFSSACVYYSPTKLVDRQFCLNFVN